jgi:triosephosphate isomerase
MNKMMRKFFVGGNWKCNNTLGDTQGLIAKTINSLNFAPEKTEVAIFPASIHLTEVKNILSNKNVYIGCQNISKFGFGAYTGETSALHLKDLGINWTLVGHSERRSLFSETDNLVADKTKIALESNINVVLCIGETLEERQTDKTFQVIENQLGHVVKSIQNKASWSKIVIAYEPVWAIGTGKVASPEQAQEVHAFIRKFMADLVSKEVSDAVRIIYGGSVTEKNCEELITKNDIDGFLVGGASLKPGFADIINAVNKAN